MEKMFLTNSPFDLIASVVQNNMMVRLCLFYKNEKMFMTNSPVFDLPYSKSVYCL